MSPPRDWVTFMTIYTDVVIFNHEHNFWARLTLNLEFEIFWQKS